MRNTLLLIAFALMFNWAAAQSQRLVFIEEFTQASCPPCASQNPAFNALLGNNTTKAVSLKYQVSWPGSDVMNAQNPAQVANRVAYYAVTGVPNAVVDGNASQGSPSGVTQSIIDNQYAIPSPFTIELTHWFNAADDSIYINCVVTATQATTMAMPKLRIALMEKIIDFTGQTPAGTNGEMVFESVMRKMYPNAQGSEIAGTWGLGESKTFSIKAIIPSYIYDKAELAVVAWVQDDADKNVKQAGFSEFAGTPSTLAPVSDFSADVMAPCDGVVHFRDESALFPTSWLWDFGDGSTATAQNPSHNYLANGNYTVTMSATNANGSDQAVKTSYIQVSLTGNAPTGVNGNVCASGVANLSAVSNTGGDITWYDGSGVVVGNGPTYSPTVTGTTSFFASEAIANPVLTTGAADTSIAAGIFFTANNTHGLYFDVALPCVLQSVEVYAGAAGNRTIDVLDSYGVILHSLTANMPAGLSTVNLNFDFAVGQGYLIKISSATVNLFRNAGGATYPYVNNAITITGNTAAGNPAYYYFFYNWKVQQNPCMSPTATVMAVDTCAVGALDPSTLAQSMQVSPNPSQGVYQLVFEAARKDDYTISVTNALGQVVYHDQLSGFKGSYAAPVDLSGLGAGVYFLAISDSRNRVVKQLVKN